MEAQSKPGRWTYAEFARLPSEGSTRYEVIAGELVMTPAPGRRHQRVSMRLSAAMHDFATANGLGEVYHAPFDVLFAEGDFLEPDILFVRHDRLNILSDRGVEAAPDLVVEILSPSTVTRDRGIKLERYRHFGVPECWVVDPDARTIEVWRFADGAEDPEVFGAGDILRWSSEPEAATLMIEVGAVLASED